MSCACSIDWGLVTSAVAVAISLFALYQTHRHKVIEARPWFVLEDVVLKALPEGQWLEAKVRHVSGGVALNLTYLVRLGDVEDLETSGAPALVPNSEGMLVWRIPQGMTISADLPLQWVFTFQDQYHNRYRITQTVNLSKKHIAYASDKM
jgi:hypothetical protein